MNIPSSISLNTPDKATTSPTVSDMCRNCGREVAHVMQDFCGQPDCDDVAALPRRQAAVSEDPLHVHDGIWSPVAIVAYCQEVRARIAAEQAAHHYPDL